MRIHILGINYWPEQTGIAVFTTGRATSLAARGHDVTMCTAPPYYPEWRIGHGYRKFWFGRERRDGVEILRCPLFVPSVVTPRTRVLHEASFIASALVRSLFARRPHVLFVVSPPLGLAVAAYVLSRWWGVPYVFHVEDLQPDTALDLGMMRPGRIARLLYAVERLAYRHAALVSTLTGAMRERIISKGVAADKVVRFSLWADPPLFDLPPRADDVSIRRELGLGDSFVVLHAGNMGVKQGLGVILEAARQAHQDANIRYVLVGDGAMRGALEERARSLNVNNVQFVPLLSHDRFMRLLSTADVCLVCQQRAVADVVFPSKVVTLLAAAKPVIASVAAASEVARVIEAAGAGVVIPPEDGGLLAAAVERLRQDARLRHACGSAGRRYARRHWHRSETLDYLGQRLAALVSGGIDQDAAADSPVARDA